MKRVVNGFDADGKATVLYEGEPPSRFDFGFATSTEVWATPSVPAPFRVSDDPTAGPFQVEPPLGGSVCRIATYAPGASVDLHSTRTVDYAIVVSGQLTLLLEDREIALDPGDVVVQLAAPHGWANRGDSECVVAVVLMTAEGASADDRIAWP